MSVSRNKLQKRNEKKNEASIVSTLHASCQEVACVCRRIFFFRKFFRTRIVDITVGSRAGRRFDDTTGRFSIGNQGNVGAAQMLTYRKRDGTRRCGDRHC